MTFTLIRRIFYMNSTFIHATFFWREASALYNTIPKEYYYFLLPHLWISVRRWFFFMLKPWHGVPHRRLARDKSLFFLPKLLKNSFFSAKLLVIKQNRCFSPKKAGPRGFLHFRGVLPPCLYTKLAVCTEKLRLLLSFGTSGHLKTKICDALMT